MEIPKVTTKLSTDELMVIRNALINQEDTKIAIAVQRGMNNLNILQDIDKLLQPKDKEPNGIKE